MLERGLCCLLLGCVMQHHLGSCRQTTSEVWDCARGPVPDGCGEGPLCSLAAREGAGVLGVEQLPAAQADGRSGRWGAGKREKHAMRPCSGAAWQEAAGCAFCSVLPSQVRARKRRTVKCKPRRPWCLLAGKLAHADVGKCQQLHVVGGCSLTCDSERVP